MHVNEHAVEVAAPAATVFPYLVEPELRLRWMGVLVAADRLTEGETGAGSRFRDVFEDHGRRIELDAEVVRYEPPTDLEVHLRSNGFESTSRSELEEADGRTRVAVTIETEYRRRAARLLAGVVTRHAQAQLERDLAALKALVEGAR